MVCRAGRTGVRSLMRGCGAFRVPGRRSSPTRGDVSSEGASSGPGGKQRQRLGTEKSSATSFPQEPPWPRSPWHVRARWGHGESRGSRLRGGEAPASTRVAPGLCPPLPRARGLAASRSCGPAPEQPRSISFPLMLSLILFPPLPTGLY